MHYLSRKVKKRPFRFRRQGAGLNGCNVSRSGHWMFTPAFRDPATTGHPTFGPIADIDPALYSIAAIGTAVHKFPPDRQEQAIAVIGGGKTWEFGRQIIERSSHTAWRVAENSSARTAIQSSLP